jgi:hypothetical protein
VVDQQQFDQALLSLYGVLFGAVQTDTATPTTISSQTSTTTTATRRQAEAAPQATYGSDPEEDSSDSGGGVGLPVVACLVFAVAGVGLAVAYRKGVLPDSVVDKLKAYAKFQEESNGPSHSDPAPENVGAPRAPKPPPLPTWAKKLAGSGGSHQDSSV